MVTPAVRLTIGAALTAGVLAVVIAYPTSTNPTIAPTAPTAPAAVVPVQSMDQGHHHGGGRFGGR